MLSPNAIFRKTDAGVAEVSARALGLRAAVRRILIMVDGRHTLATLSATVRAEEIESIIHELQALSLIDTAGGIAVANDLRTTLNVASDTSTAKLVTEMPAESDALSSVDFPIESRAETGSNVAKPNTVVNDAAAYVSEPTIAQFISARQAAVRALNDILGPRSETFALRIEKCKTANELREQVTLIRQSLANIVNENAAVRFVEAVREGAKV
jgi:hypothetical protein